MLLGRRCGGRGLAMRRRRGWQHGRSSCMLLWSAWPTSRSTGAQCAGARVFRLPLWLHPAHAQHPDLQGCSVGCWVCVSCIRTLHARTAGVAGNPAAVRGVSCVAETPLVMDALALRFSNRCCCLHVLQPPSAGRAELSMRARPLRVQCAGRRRASARWCAATARCCCRCSSGRTTRACGEASTSCTRSSLPSWCARGGACATCEGFSYVVAWTVMPCLHECELCHKSFASLNDKEWAPYQGPSLTGFGFCPVLDVRGFPPCCYPCDISCLLRS